MNELQEEISEPFARPVTEKSEWWSLSLDPCTGRMQKFVHNKMLRTGNGPKWIELDIFQAPGGGTGESVGMGGRGGGPKWKRKSLL